MMSSEMRMALDEIGADIPTALNRLNNNEGLYQKLLTIFYKSNADAPAQYRAHIAADETDALLRLVHDLKSSSGNLGLASLYDMAVDFEMQIKTTHTLDKDVAEALTAKLETVLQVLSAV